MAVTQFSVVLTYLSIMCVNGFESTQANATFDRSLGGYPFVYNMTALPDCYNVHLSNNSGIVKSSHSSGQEGGPCKVFLPGNGGKSIRLIFKRLQLITSPDCFASNITVYQGLAFGLIVLDRFCGTHEPFNVTYGGGPLIIEFTPNQQSNGLQFLNSFEMEYTFLNISLDRLREKAIGFYGQFGHLVNTQNSALYQFLDRYVYIWTITVSPINTIYMEWSFRNISNDMYLEITDGPLRNVLPSFCQGSKNNDLYGVFGKCDMLYDLTTTYGNLSSTMSNLLIVFSDSISQYETFILNYTEINAESYVMRCGNTRIILSDAWPYILRKSFTKYERCVLTFTTDEPYGIYVEFVEIVFKGYNHGRREHGRMRFQQN